MLRVFFSLAFTVSGFMFLVFSAWLLWKNDSLSNEIENKPASELQGQIQYPLLVIEPLRKFLFKMGGETNVDLGELTLDLQLYLSRNPLDADAWLVGSRIQQQSGNIDLASSYLSVAHSLSETNTPVLLRVFNRYLELNLIDEAMLVAHDIVVAKPHEFRRLFYLMARLSKDQSLLVDRMIPKQAKKNLIQNHPNKIKNIYYQWALTDLMRSKNTFLAKEVWKAIPLDEKNNSDIGIKFINYLSQFQKLDDFKTIWREVIGKPLLSGVILNNDIANSSPCWQINSNENVIANISKSDEAALIEIDFLGKENINYNHIRCLASVEPNSRYILKGRYKSDDISTLSGIFVDISFPGLRKKVARSEEIIGTKPWTGLEIFFDVPDNVNFVEFRIRRNATKLLDSKISGKVWFDSFEMAYVK